MNRLDLVEILATKHNLSKAEAARVWDTLSSAIVASVKKGEPVQLMGFGTFKSVNRAARKGYNPKTGESVKVQAVKLPKFVAGTAFRAAVDPKAAKRKAEKKAAGAAKPAAAPAKKVAKKK